jgi:hypothetical protein
VVTKFSQQFSIFFIPTFKIYIFMKTFKPLFVSALWQLVLASYNTKAPQLQPILNDKLPTKWLPLTEGTSKPLSHLG